MILAALLLLSFPARAESPAADIAAFCRSVARSCAVDLTPKEPCDPPERAKGARGSIMDVQAACPGYGWTEENGVFLFAPKDRNLSRAGALPKKRKRGLSFWTATCGEKGCAWALTSAGASRPAGPDARTGPQPRP